MTDIVRTIQAEQDRIIRADAPRRAGRAGRPGHRQDRRRPAPRRLPALHPPRAAGPQRRADRRPQPDVPALHRRGAALPRRDRRRARRPRRACCPGVEAHAAERPEVAEVKGRLAMADVDRRRRRATGRRCPTARSRSTIDGTPLRFTPDRTPPAPGPAPGPPPGCTTRPGRPSSARVIDRLDAASTPTGSGADVRGGDSLLDARRSRRAAPRGRRRAGGARADRPALAAADRRAAARATCSPPATGWSRPPPAGTTPTATLLLRPAVVARGPPADVPLLDEADELLGVDDSAERAAARRDEQRRRQRRPGDPRPAARLPLAGRRDRGGGRGAAAPSTCSTPRAWPPARRSATPGRRPSAPPPTAPGPTAT